MSNFNSDFKKILSDLEENIKNKEDLEFVKLQMFNLYNVFFEELSKLEELANSRVSEIAANQSEIEERLSKIEDDIYVGDEYDEEEDYNFSIACPYCDKDFELEIEELKDEVVCPHCNNTVELDWGADCEDDECGCSGCGHHCHHDEDDDM